MTWEDKVASYGKENSKHSIANINIIDKDEIRLTGVDGNRIIGFIRKPTGIYVDSYWAGRIVSLKEIDDLQEFVSQAQAFFRDGQK